MREVRIKVADGYAAPIVQMIQALGVDRVGISREFVHGPDRWEEVVSTETSTPEAAAIVAAVTRASVFDPQMHAITVRELRAIMGSTPIARVTLPLDLPFVDVEQDLWQFCHVTYGHLGRVVVAASLLAYAMIRGNVLLSVAGLLFLPALPHLLAIARAACARDRHLAAQAACALSSTIAVVTGCSALVALLVPGPMKFDDFLSPLVAASVSIGIGVAGALASVDDVGKRELIGLATAAQVGIVPVWLGIALVQGFDASPGSRVLSYVANLVLIVVGSMLVYLLVHARQCQRAQRPARRGSQG
jgi:hypothetical protein